MATLATLQQLRTFEFNNHPLNLEEGQLAFNISSDNFDSLSKDYNIYMYVGNGSNQRIDEDGTVLVSGGTAKKGWVRFRLRNVSVQGDDIYGDLNVINSRLKVRKEGVGNSAEFILPTQTESPTSGSQQASLRWNTTISALQAWDGSKWDSTTKVSVGFSPPSNPSSGDLWFNISVNTLFIYITPSGSPAEWVIAAGTAADTALQPGNGVTPNLQNQIETINSGLF